MAKKKPTTKKTPKPKPCPICRTGTLVKDGSGKTKGCTNGCNLIAGLG